MFDKKIKTVAETVNELLNAHEKLDETIDRSVKTTDDIKGRKSGGKSDDVGPAADGKSTKYRYHPEEFKSKLFNSLKEDVLDEASEDMLARYLKAHGVNPITTPKDTKIAYSKSDGFKKWLRDHELEESSYEDYSDEELTEMINEVLSKDAKAGDWIHDFVTSDNPKFKGKSKEKRKKMALAAYYATQRNEEWEAEPETKEPEAKDDDELKKSAKKNTRVLVKISKAFAKKKVEEEVEQIDELKKSTLGSYVKKASKNLSDRSFEHGEDEHRQYGMGDDEDEDKRVDRDEKKIATRQQGINRAATRLSKEGVELEEGKRPESDDSVPWVGGSEPAQDDVKDKGTGGMHTPMSRAKHLARMSLKKVKKEVGVKEEVEQIDEISAGLADRYLSKKRDRDYVSTGPNTSQRKEPQTIDQAMKDGKNTARALKRSSFIAKYGKKKAQ